MWVEARACTLYNHQQHFTFFYGRTTTKWNNNLLSITLLIPSHIYTQTKLLHWLLLYTGNLKFTVFFPLLHPHHTTDFSFKRSLELLYEEEEIERAKKKSTAAASTMRNIMNFFITHFPQLSTTLTAVFFFLHSLFYLRLLLLLFNINVLLVLLFFIFFSSSNGDYSWLVRGNAFNYYFGIVFFSRFSTHHFDDKNGFYNFYATCMWHQII